MKFASLFSVSGNRKRQPMVGKRDQSLLQRRFFSPQLELLEDRTVPATLTVTNTSGLAATVGSLAYEVNIANTNGSATNTIVFANNLHGKTINETTTLHITKSLAIQGSDQTINGGGTIQIFNITGSPVVTVTMSDLNIANGKATNGGGLSSFQANVVLNDVNFTGNTATAGGGAIYNHNGTMTITNSSFTGNSETSNTIGSGGGAIVNQNASLIVTGTTFTDNTASGSTQIGGAIYNFRSTLTASHDTFTDNHAGFSGGALGNAGGVMTTSNSMFSGNSAVEGGAVGTTGESSLTLQLPTGTYNSSHDTFTDNHATSTNGNGGAIAVAIGSATISNDNFTNNTAGDGGGAIIDTNLGESIEEVDDFGLLFQVTITNSNFTGNSAEDGGAVAGTGTALEQIKGSTFTQNSSTQEGGAIYESGGSVLTLTNSTIQNNTATTEGGGIDNLSSIVSIVSSTVKKNTAPTGADIHNSPGAIYQALNSKIGVVVTS